MKVIAITVEVDDDVDITTVYDQILFEYDLDADSVVVYENVGALIADHVSNVSH